MLRLVFGPFLLDRQGGQLLRDGERVEIAPKTRDLLAYLAQRPGVLVSKEEMLDAVWGHRFVSESVLKVAINSLRVALGEDAREPRWVHTVPRRGYRFASDVQVLGPTGQPLPAGAVAALLAAQAGDADEAPAAGPGNLPANTAPLLGRDNDQARLCMALQGNRLVTLTGPGGVGKTRLALASAGHQAPADGVWLLRLDAMGAQDPVGPALARLLGLAEAAGTDATALGRAMSPLCLRVVLDNAEHMVEALAPQVATWLQLAPQLRLLLTSQRPLHLAGELVLPLDPLALPEPDADVAALRDNPAVALLRQRIRAAQPNWAPQDADWHDLAQIARGLDGLPLALELAAARVPVMGARAVNQRLGDRLRMLTRGAAEAPQRHKTLRAALEWGVSLLPEPAARLLDHCAVFMGGFTLEAVQALAAVTLPELDEWALIDHLDLLREMALIQDAGTPATPLVPARGSPQAEFIALDWFAAPRLRMLDSVRLLGLEHLAASGDTQHVFTAHIDGLRALLNRAEHVQLDLSEAVWLGKVEPETSNLAVALSRALQAARGAQGQGGAALDAGVERVADLFAAAVPLLMRSGQREQLKAGWFAVEALLQPPEGGAVPTLSPLMLARLDLAKIVLATQGLLKVPDGIRSIDRAAPVLHANGQRRRLLLARFMGLYLQLANTDVDDARRTVEELRELVGTNPTPYERRILPWAEAALARQRGDLGTYGRFFQDMLAECQQRGDRIESWRAGWGAGQALFLTGQVEAAVRVYDAAVDDLRIAGRMRTMILMVGQAASVRLFRDSSPESLQRAREAAQLLRPGQQIAFGLGDALPWVAWRQGRRDAALRLHAWSQGAVQQRKEQRGPLNDLMRAALLAEFGPLQPPAESGLDDDSAVRLALEST